MKKQIKNKLLLVAAGIVAGAVNGLFGGGGGMLVVPVLTVLLAMPPKRAHATALFVILPITVLSGLVYALFGNFSLPVGIPAGCGVVAGGVIGALALKKISNARLTKIFAFVILLAGVKLLFF